MKEKAEDLAEHKLIILYIMSATKCSLTNLQILKLLYDFENFNYYYFQHLLSELVEKNYIFNYQQGEDWLYEITPEGRNILELTSNILPGITKHKLDISLKTLLPKVRDEMAVTAEYVLDDDKAYITKCKISEGHKTLFELNIYCVSQDQAKLVSTNWNRNANKLYPKIIDLLTK